MLNYLLCTFVKIGALSICHRPLPLHLLLLSVMAFIRYYFPFSERYRYGLFSGLINVPGGYIYINSYNSVVLKFNVSIKGSRAKIKFATRTAVISTLLVGAIGKRGIPKTGFLTLYLRPLVVVFHSRF